VQQVGDPLELYNQPANRFVAGFIGSPAMNFVNVTVIESNGSLRAESSGLSVKLPDETAQRLRGHVNREVTLGVRPEDLMVASAADRDMPCFDAVIEVVEQLGSEILLDMKVGDRRHGCERRADRARQGAGHAAPCHAPVRASRLRCADRGGDLNAGNRGADLCNPLAALGTKARTRSRSSMRTITSGI